MCKKLKPKFTFVRGFLLCLFLFILFVIAFFGFKAYPEFFSDIGVTQFIDNTFHNNNDKNNKEETSKNENIENKENVKTEENLVESENNVKE